MANDSLKKFRERKAQMEQTFLSIIREFENEFTVTVKAVNLSHDQRVAWHEETMDLKIRIELE